MNVRHFRDRFLPFLTKQRVYAVVNAGLRALLPPWVTRSLLAPALQRNAIDFVDLGGWAPVEQYLTLHLSPVELYGIPMMCRATFRQDFDETRGLTRLVARRLESVAVSLSFDIGNGLPLHDASLSGVNLSHFLEHFDIDRGRAILLECRRVLRAGGVARVSCPDLRKYARAYLSGDSAYFSAIGSPAFCNYPNLPTFGAILAGKAYDGMNGHKWFYDSETVVALLKEAGFASARARDLHQSALPRIAEVEPAYRAVESFYVEAIA
jgi:predicted SAM-dependent methyltransferase